MWPFAELARSVTYLTHGVDVDVVLGLLRVRHEWLDEEIPQLALNVLDLLDLVRSRLNPFSRLCPCCVQLQQTGLSSPLDELV